MNSQNQESKEEMRDRMRKENLTKENTPNYVDTKMDKILSTMNETKDIVEKGIKRQERSTKFVFGFGVGFAAIGMAASLAAITNNKCAIFGVFGAGLATMIGYALWYWCCRHQRWEK